MDLTTTYMGLRLRSPIVASAGPLTGRVDSARALADAGIGAVVLPSLFEEQVVHEALATSALMEADGSNPEAASYFPDLQATDSVADRYVRHLEDTKRAVDVPVIASLNGTSAAGWERYARLLQDAGADALELNLYRVAADVHTSGAAVEQEQLDLVGAVRDVLMIPLAVKVSPFYSSVAHMAAGLVAAGADALVVFNRFYQPDVSPVTREVVPSLELSSPAELRLVLRWLGLLHGRLDADLAATTGIHSGLDVARALLAGADVTMMTSALLRHGPGHVATCEQELVAWAHEQGYASVAQLRGSASQQRVTDPAGFERANYVEGLIAFANSFR
ncbi:dihydroorotate dehydrogenase-like protein [Euzebya rosea]|uniref:dihydroorotate dehydrogenase-like protein n=1 Tax=Euzebya rosea TaxID=2052804 RepID=UPI00196B501C|nr:dihydroorotate dehydrogenase-like protein [Euzebya rosea]